MLTSEPLIESALSSVPKNTERAYRRNWQYFRAWCDQQEVRALPASPESVRAYISFLRNSSPLRPSSIRQRIAAITFIHRSCNMPVPTENTDVKHMLRDLRNEMAAGTAAGARTRKRPALARDVRRLIDALPPTRFGWRDRAMLLLMFAGGMRAAELVGLDCQDIHIEPDRLRMSVLYPSSSSETLRTVEIPRSPEKDYCPVNALEQWLSAASISSGPVFRALGRYASLSDRAISEATVTLVIKRAACLAGIDPTSLSAESLRSGLVISADAGGADRESIMRHAGYSHVESVNRQIRRHASLIENPAFKAWS